MNDRQAIQQAASAVGQAVARPREDTQEQRQSNVEFAYRVLVGLNPTEREMLNARLTASVVKETYTPDEFQQLFDK